LNIFKYALRHFNHFFKGTLGGFSLFIFSFVVYPGRESNLGRRDGNPASQQLHHPDSLESSELGVEVQGGLAALRLLFVYIKPKCLSGKGRVWSGASGKGMAVTAEKGHKWVSQKQVQKCLLF